MNKKNNGKTNIWDAIRDVLIHSMNKGQLPLLSVAAIIALIIWKLPPEALERLVSGIIPKALIVSLPINIILPISWWLHVKWQRKKVASEIERLGLEKSGLQEQLHGQKLSSSEKTSRPRQSTSS